jgi:hypothetical protein
MKNKMSPLVIASAFAVCLGALIYAGSSFNRPTYLDNNTVSSDSISKNMENVKEKELLRRYFLDGKEITMEQVATIDPNIIKTIDGKTVEVSKGESEIHVFICTK